MTEALADVTGTVVTCDIAHDDRGKTHVLGAGWTECAPGRRVLHLLVTLEIPWTFERRPFEVRVELWRYEDWRQGTGALATAELSGVIAGDELPVELRDAPHPPSSQSVLPVPIVVDLEPEAPFLVVLRHEGRPLSFAAFQTRPAQPASDQDDSAALTADSRSS